MVMAYSLDPSSSEEHTGGEESGTLTLRPRSPSPFLSVPAKPSVRSHSLSARKDSSTSKSIKSRPSSRESSHKDLYLDTQDEGRQAKARKKSGIYAKSKRRNTPDPTAVTQYRDGSSRMSSELPPIGRTGSAASLSRRGSRESRDSTPNQQTVQLNKPIIAKRTEKQVLISIDSPTHTGDLLTTLNPAKRSHLSPGSQTTGSSSQSISNKSSGANLTNPGFLKHRAKSWCTTDTEAATAAAGAGLSGSKLETVLERNGVVGAATMKANKASGLPRNSSNNSLSALHNQPLTQAKRTKSYSNLAKTTDTGSKNTASNPVHAMRNKSLSRYKSETSLDMLGSSSNNNPGNFTTRTTTHTSRPIPATRNGYSKVRTNTAVVPSRSNKSQPSPLQHSNSNKDSSLSAQNLKMQQNGVVPNISATPQGNNHDDSDSDSDKNERIIQWLIGVDTASMERPPTPDIEEEKSPRDTAIHIVYGED